MLTIEVKAVTSKIIGTLDPKVRSTLYAQLSYKEPGSFFAKQKNRFAADVKCLITDKRQEFRTGLLSRVCRIFDEAGEEYALNDKREVGAPDHFMPLGDHADMRDYQWAAIEEAVVQRTGMERIATGGGKTRIMAGIAARLERRTIILVHRVDLLHQVLDVFKSLFDYADEIIGMVGGGVYEPKLITVCTVQTICAALGIVSNRGEDDDDETPRGAELHKDAIVKMLTEAQVCIVDEAHHAPAKTISEVMKHITNATWRIGMSATDWRDDGADLLIEAAIGPRIIDVTLSDLVDQGWLVPPTIQMVPLDYAGYCDAQNWAAIYKFYYTDNGFFDNQIVRQNKQWHEDGRTILTLVTQVKHGKKLERLHIDKGIETIFIHGGTSTVERNRIMERVRSKSLRHIIGTSIADEGLDIPTLDALNLAGGGKSTTKAYQRIGRVMRLSPGKIDCLVADYRVKGEKTINTQCGRRANIYRKEPRFTFTEVKEK